MNRRKFVSMFAAASVGMTVADKVRLLEEMKNWVLSPQKTIFIPPEPKIFVPEIQAFQVVLQWSADNDQWIYYAK